MKRFPTALRVLLYLTVLTNTAWGQATLPAIEHFDYSLGQLQIVGTNWTRVSGNSNDLNVITGNLTYNGYPMDAIGNQISISSSGTDDDKLTFSSQSAVDNTIYASFLLNVTNTTEIGSGDYFAALGNGLGTFSARVYIKLSGTGFQLGIARNTIIVAGWNGIDLSIGTTYLVVLGYTIVFGTKNDIAKLWVNPDLSGAEPSPTVIDNNITASDASSIDGFFIRQGSGTPNANIDALRIGLSWIDVPLPIQLTSFSVSPVYMGAYLNWKTITETNCYGFDVERRAVSNQQSVISDWSKIGFVEGAGNSNSAHVYSYIDHHVTWGRYIYRLKQIDQDGNFQYYGNTEVEISTATTTLTLDNYPNPFNPTTTVVFSVPKDGHATLKVFNIIGQEIGTLFNGIARAGHLHSVLFGGFGLASGVYYYAIEYGGHCFTKRMLIVK